MDYYIVIDGDRSFVVHDCKGRVDAILRLMQHLEKKNTEKYIETLSIDLIDEQLNVIIAGDEKNGKNAHM